MCFNSWYRTRLLSSIHSPSRHYKSFCSFKYSPNFIYIHKYRITCVHGWMKLLIWWNLSWIEHVANIYFPTCSIKPQTAWKSTKLWTEVTTWKVFIIFSSILKGTFVWHLRQHGNRSNLSIMFNEVRFDIDLSFCNNIQY